MTTGNDLYSGEYGINQANEQTELYNYNNEIIEKENMAWKRSCATTFNKKGDKA